jgi:hypothetical protein
MKLKASRNWIGGSNGRFQAACELIDPQAPQCQQHLATCAKPGHWQSQSLGWLAELSVLPRNLKSAQVSRYAGLDVRLCQ